MAETTMMEAKATPRERYEVAKKAFEPFGDVQRHTMDAYHNWYYNTAVWHGLRYMGVPCMKWIGDLWNYQEILFNMRPKLVVEFGTAYGGSTLWFADTLDMIHNGRPHYLLSVDIGDLEPSHVVKCQPRVELMRSSSTDPSVAQKVKELREKYDGPVFVILDSNHTREHVLAEMESLRDLLRTGDYLVVEDGNVNGHPVSPGFGPGPQEAIEEYEKRHPDDYEHDVAREMRFGFTFAPYGYLVRR